MINGQMRLDGKCAIVTGGSQGLGLGMAEALASIGADVAIIARSREKLAAAAERIAAYGSKVVSVSADLSSVDEVIRAIDEAVSQLGRLDVVVAAAGTQVRKPALELTPEDWEKVCAVNLRAVFFTSQRAAHHMLKNDQPETGKTRGKIILVTSLTAEVPWPDVSVYGITKAGVAQMTKALAREWGPQGICVNAIGPGTFPTALTEPLYADEARAAALVQRVPLGRAGTPEDLAGAAVLLATSASDYMTGQVVWVDGGWLTG